MFERFHVFTGTPCNEVTTDIHINAILYILPKMFLLDNHCYLQLDILWLKRNVERHMSCRGASAFPAGLLLLYLPGCFFLHSTTGCGPSCYIAPTCIYVCLCVCAWVSSCTYRQLMKSKCLAAVVTVVRLSQCLQSKATKLLDSSRLKQWPREDRFM